MKTILIIVLLSLSSFSSCSQAKKSTTPSSTSSDITTYYFIRHSEKDRSNPSEKNPHLKDEGLNRANNWRHIFGSIKFDAVYSTEYHRTRETAKPTADKNKLELIIYDPSKLNNIDEFLKTTKGKTVLVVGHSNTTPAFVNAVLKQNKYEDIDDSNNGNLYIVTIIGDKFVDQVLTIN